MVLCARARTWAAGGLSLCLSLTKNSRRRRSARTCGLRRRCASAPRARRARAPRPSTSPSRARGRGSSGRARGPCRLGARLALLRACHSSLSSRLNGAHSVVDLLLATARTRRARSSPPLVVGGTPFLCFVRLGAWSPGGLRCRAMRDGHARSALRRARPRGLSGASTPTRIGWLRVEIHERRIADNLLWLASHRGASLFSGSALKWLSGVNI